MRGVCDFTDFFVIATGRNARQTKAIYDEVAGVLKQELRPPPALVGGSGGGDVDRRRLPRRRPPSVHARDARLLPTRGALERRAVRRARGRDRLGRVAVVTREVERRPPVRVGASGRRGSRTPTPPSTSSRPAALRLRRRVLGRNGRSDAEAVAPGQGSARAPLDWGRSWGHSSAGRALAWHARGRRFEPGWLHRFASMAQAAMSCRPASGLFVVVVRDAERRSAHL